MSLGTVVKRRQPPRCPCGNCQERGLCADHRVLLAEVRVMLDDETKRIPTRRKYGAGDGTHRVSTCCSPDCLSPRRPPAMFCESCLEASE